MFQDYKDLLSAFHAHGVKYLIVGGYAVSFHAQPIPNPTQAGCLCYEEWHRHSCLCRVERSVSTDRSRTSAWKTLQTRYDEELVLGGGWIE